jgi:hypothetical protein
MTITSHAPVGHGLFCYIDLFRGLKVPEIKPNVCLEQITP